MANNGKVIVSVVDVGQGQCTFVEVWDKDNPFKLNHTLLFDCGSDKPSSQTQNNLKYIADTVSLMSEPAFDCIFFSHSDSDHISLTYDLLNKFSASKKPEVKDVWFGGAYDEYTKNGFNILDYLDEEGYCDSENLREAPSNYSDFNPDEEEYTNSMWASPDTPTIYVYAVGINVLKAKPDFTSNDMPVDMRSGEPRNRVSMVCGLYYGNTCYIICGDATKATMAAIGGHFPTDSDLFDDNIMTTLPHHGSRTTGLSVSSNKKASTNAVRIVTAFATLMKSKTITVSAYEHHSHPSLELMTLFIPTTTSPWIKDPRINDTNSHCINAFIDLNLTHSSGTKVPKSTYPPFDSQINIFTTRYLEYAPSPPAKKKKTASGTSASTTMVQNLDFSYDFSGLDVQASSGFKPGGAINEFSCWKYEQASSTSSPSVRGYTDMGLFSLFTSAVTGSLTAPVLETTVPNRSAARSLKPPAQKVTSFRNKLKRFS